NGRRGRPDTDPAGAPPRVRRDPATRADASTLLDDDVIADARAHADERVVADRARSELHVMSDGDADTQHEITTVPIGRQDAVVLHVAARADDDAAVSCRYRAAEEDAGVVAPLDVTGDQR